MRYVCAKLEHAQKEEAYRVYVTDALRAILGGEENARYKDWITPPQEETRTAEEIIDHIKQKLAGA